MSIADSPFGIYIPLWKASLKQTRKKQTRNQANKQNLDKLFLLVSENAGRVYIALK